jgi:hypothetical protein
LSPRVANSRWQNVREKDPRRSSTGEVSIAYAPFNGRGRKFTK